MIGITTLSSCLFSTHSGIKIDQFEPIVGHKSDGGDRKGGADARVRTGAAGSAKNAVTDNQSHLACRRAANGHRYDDVTCDVNEPEAARPQMEATSGAGFDSWNRQRRPVKVRANTSKMLSADAETYASPRPTHLPAPRTDVHPWPSANRNRWRQPLQPHTAHSLLLFFDVFTLTFYIQRARTRATAIAYRRLGHK